MLKHVIFDLGNVLIDWNPRHLYRKIFSNEKEMEDFLANVCTLEWNEEMDAGLPFAEGVARLQARFPHLKEEIQAYDSRWPEMLTGPIEPVVGIFKRLKESGVKLYALSNWSDEKYPDGAKLCPFFELFDGMVISGRIGMKKPDPKIFEYLCRTFDVRAEECVFVDDNLRNIEAARRLGFQEVHYKTPEDLEARLKSFGFLKKGSI